MGTGCRHVTVLAEREREFSMSLEQASYAATGTLSHSSGQVLFWLLNLGFFMFGFMR